MKPTFWIFVMLLALVTSQNLGQIFQNWGRGIQDWGRSIQNVVDQGIRKVELGVQNLNKDIRNVVDQGVQNVDLGVQNLNKDIQDVVGQSIQKVDLGVQNLNKDIQNAVGQSIQKVDLGVQNLNKDIRNVVDQGIRNVDLGVQNLNKNIQDVVGQSIQKVDLGVQNLNKDIQDAVGQNIQKVDLGVQNLNRAIQDVGLDIQKEVVALKHPVLETISIVVSSQCVWVKQLYGLTYEQMLGKKEPDVNQLKLVYKTRSFNLTYNISEAAEALQQTSAFKASEKVVIYVHGFTDNPALGSFTHISNSLLQSEEGDRITLLALDGSPLIGSAYFRATTYIVFMGQKLAEVLVAMVNNGLNPSNIHMVGHSLGAHISGFTGKQFYILTGRKIGRISGLDPAGPCFTYINETCRLRSSDADYVDVIHSDAGILGIRTPVGHADYYPNSGEQQPECFLPMCSHSRAWELFGESERQPLTFIARRCDTWSNYTQGLCQNEISYMGYASTPDTRGLFFLQTRGSSPYGLGMNGVLYNDNVGVVRNLQSSVMNLPVFSKLRQV